MSGLGFINLSMNRLEGEISETHFSKLFHLHELDLSYNSLLEFNVTSDWVPPFQLSYLSLRSCKVGPDFPKWIRTQKGLSNLDMSYGDISDVFPSWFWSLFGDTPTIDMSNNQIRGTLGSSKVVSFSGVEVRFSSNQLEGPIPSFLSKASYLDLSDNKFSEMTSFLCSSNVKISKFLDLSSNHIPGELPDCWRHWVNLELLDLSNNSFSGKIPPNIGCLLQIKTLKLRSNRLVGELPSSLKNCTSLNVIDLGNNTLSSSVPEWLGVSLPNLVILMLQSNQLSGSLPSQLCHLARLQILDVSMNEISGTIPKCLDSLTSLAQEGNSNLTIRHSFNVTYSNGNVSSLYYEDDATFMWKRTLSTYKNTLGLVKSIDLSSNRLTGEIPSEITHLVGLVSLNLSRNNLTGQIPLEIGKLKSLDSLDLSRNKIGGGIPTSLARIDRLGDMDLSYNNLSGEIPTGTQLQSFDPTIDMSNNQIRGTLGSSKVVSFSGVEVRFSSNQLEGPIPSFLSKATYLDLSDNKFSEMTSFLCSANVKISKFLDLSTNHIPGEVPDCWRHWVNLELLDLSNNYFSGKIPPNIGCLVRIKTLKLRSNRLVGELPSSLKNCTSLNVIDLGNNTLSSSVPEWLGVSLSNLVILMLQSNQFSGSLPSQLCHLARLQILDVSGNQISGSIPKCLDSLTSLVQEGNSNLTIRHSFNTSEAEPPMSSLYYEDDATFMWKRTLSTYKNTLGLVKSIDLSCNRLTGEIPSEITHLVGLVSLNLSRNNLTGQIPPEIGKLKSLDSLDLSRNKIGGRIPTSLARIYGLGVMDLSYNNLSGEIPTGTQLQSFDRPSYAGNPHLCGRPLEACNLEGTGRPNVSSDQADPDELITSGFYISLGLGFAVEFWVVCGSLIFKRSWRYAYYNFLNGLNDWLYVRVALIRRQLKDMLSGQS